MRHARADYNRIQDPAANTALIDAYAQAAAMVARGPRMATGLADASALTREAYAVLSQLVGALTSTVGAAIFNPGGVRDGKVNPIGEDEPVFLLRARDQFAPDTVRYWVTIAYNRGEGVDGDTRAAVEKLAESMEAWATAHGGAKIPDTPADVAFVDATTGTVIPRRTPQVGDPVKRLSPDALSKLDALRPSAADALLTPPTQLPDMSVYDEKPIDTLRPNPVERETRLRDDIAKQIEGTNGGTEPR